jgi:hypothetical protein
MISTSWTAVVRRHRIWSLLLLFALVLLGLSIHRPRPIDWIIKLQDLQLPQQRAFYVRAYYQARRCIPLLSCKYSLGLPMGGGGWTLAGFTETRTLMMKPGVDEVKFTLPQRQLFSLSLYQLQAMDLFYNARPPDNRDFTIQFGIRGTPATLQTQGGADGTAVMTLHYATQFGESISMPVDQNDLPAFTSVRVEINHTPLVSTRIQVNQPFVRPGSTAEVDYRVEIVPWNAMGHPGLDTRPTEAFLLSPDAASKFRLFPTFIVSPEQWKQMQLAAETDGGWELMVDRETRKILLKVHPLPRLKEVELVVGTPDASNRSFRISMHRMRLRDR